MFIRPKLVVGLACIATGAALLLSGCSAGTPRDIHYGTDVGGNYTPPDTRTVSSWDTSGEAIPGEAERPVDGGTVLDGNASLDESLATDTSPSLDADLPVAEGPPMDATPSIDTNPSLDEGA